MKKKDWAEIDKVIKANYGKKTYQKIGEELGMNSENVRYRARKMGLTGSGKPKKPLTVEEQVEVDLTETKDKRRLRETSSKYRVLMKKIEELERITEVLEAPRKHSSNKIVSLKSNGYSEATAFALLSDWHVEQRVRSSKLAYHNEYNLEIAKERAEETFIAIVKLIKKEQQHYKIDHLVLGLLGDFITGNIHTQLLPVLQLGMAEAVFFVEELLVKGIQYILDNTDVKITCPAVVGNHSRITDKVWISTEEDNSVETIIYYHVKKHFEGNERFELIMPDGPDRFLDVYGLTFVFTHGHHGFRYGGGIGGLYVPVRRGILTKYSQRQIYCVCMGHFHNFIQDRKFLVNGSMIGYDDYANSKGFEFDVPKQTFFLVEKRFKSRTATTPIMYTI